MACITALQARGELLAREGAEATAGLEAHRDSYRAAKALFEVGSLARLEFDPR